VTPVFKGLTAEDRIRQQQTLVSSAQGGQSRYLAIFLKKTCESKYFLKGIELEAAGAVVPSLHLA
jgi:hypothetical protein